jgi:hypothetical protein
LANTIRVKINCPFRLSSHTISTIVTYVKPKLRSKRRRSAPHTTNEHLPSPGLVCSAADHGQNVVVFWLVVGYNISLECCRNLAGSSTSIYNEG